MKWKANEEKHHHHQTKKNRWMWRKEEIKKNLPKKRINKQLIFKQMDFVLCTTCTLYSVGLQLHITHHLVYVMHNTIQSLIKHRWCFWCFLAFIVIMNFFLTSIDRLSYNFAREKKNRRKYLLEKGAKIEIKEKETKLRRATV